MDAEPRARLEALLVDLDGLVELPEPVEPCAARVSPRGPRAGAIQDEREPRICLVPRLSLG
jgi:hypothetical protein